MIAPDSFELSDIDGSSSAVSEVVPADQEDLVREAAQSCPEQAIFIDAGIDTEKPRETTP